MTVMRWGIIGVGDVTEVKSGPAFQQVPGSELVAVMRRSAELAQDYARRHNVPRWHSDADEILGADDIDAVYIATHRIPTPTTRVARRWPERPFSSRSRWRSTPTSAGR